MAYTPYLGNKYPNKVKYATDSIEHNGLMNPQSQIKTVKLIKKGNGLFYSLASQHCFNYLLSSWIYELYIFEECVYCRCCFSPLEK